MFRQFKRAFSSDASWHGHGRPGVPVLTSAVSPKVRLLHGSLDVWIFEANNLPNMERSLVHKITSDTSDPYVSILVSGAKVGKTYVIKNNENPVWMQNFLVPVAHYTEDVKFIVKDDDVVGSKRIGFVSIPAVGIYSGEEIKGSFPIINETRKPFKKEASLRLSIQYIPIEKQDIYRPGPDYRGVPGTYFPLRRGGRVTLYQDAHVPNGCLPDVARDRGVHYEQGKCWRDIFDAIKQARYLIYITGWSIYPKVTLARDGSPGEDVTLGDLLKAKSQEGLRVLLLVWDDPGSHRYLPLGKDGFMKTHDKETRRFFKHSSVQVLLCRRFEGRKHLTKQKDAIMYTHHQKTVIVDSDAGLNKRKIIAFVGGLDLCDGRYDTPEHPLFRTLQTVHKDDYYNPTFKESTLGCPREPWHDLHCRIGGPAAYDVLINFEERWAKASEPHGIKKPWSSSYEDVDEEHWAKASEPHGIKKLWSSSYEDALLKIDRNPDIIGMQDARCSNDDNDDDQENWHVQVFRSIDSYSVKGFPKDPKDATSRNLVCGKNVSIDMSMHSAYVEAIRAAQHFIYIENQYFLGSSYNWSSNSGIGANNLIPMEIALKIASKIKANERFSAYIVIPMWPEGVPTEEVLQRILFWQNKTMQMMYDVVYIALVEAGLEKTYELRDYLNFFCLGNREVVMGNDASNVSVAIANTPQEHTKKNRRFMIYVHSKGMIVDDEYVILGSANINQRSLAGNRDTEIAMGAYQPHQTWAQKKSGPHGQIYGYRMSLWAEHIGALEECFNRPESLECVRRVRDHGEQNWQQFIADEITEMKGHLLKYPIDVHIKVKVTPLAGCESFLDVGGNVKGTFLLGKENLTI